jgi:hypothetical protein
MSIRPIVLCAALVVASGSALAADQTVRGRSAQVKNPNPADQSKRKIVAQAKESASDNTVLGDPVAGGATLAIFADGATATSQTFVLPASGWRR